MTKWCKIDTPAETEVHGQLGFSDFPVARVQEVSNTAVAGWHQTEKDDVQPGWWFQNDDVQNTYTYTMDQARHRRDLMLHKSDWTQLPDNGLSTEKKAEWATYRQALRDWPSTNTTWIVTMDGSDTVWPSKPSDD